MREVTFMHQMLVLTTMTGIYLLSKTSTAQAAWTSAQPTALAAKVLAIKGIALLAIAATGYLVWHGAEKLGSHFKMERLNIEILQKTSALAFAAVICLVAPAILGINVFAVGYAALAIPLVMEGHQATQGQGSSNSFIATLAPVTSVSAET
ncbi:MAG: hypothetical protein H0X51_09560 [Parachlamydiaceae bacterium]|nr:hypothetical protein [Parachlamydiaceae bacterium]